MSNYIVLYSPSFTPMCTDSPYLFSSGRCPWRSSLTDVKTSYCNVVDKRFLRIEYRPAYINLHQFTVRIASRKIGPYPCTVISYFTIPQLTITFIQKHIFQPFRFRKGTVIQIYFSGMRPLSSCQPITMYRIIVRIEVAEQTIRDHRFPCLIVQPSPIFNDFGTFDFHFFSFSRLIGYRSLFRFSSPRWSNSLPVNTFVYDDNIPRVCPFGRSLNMTQWSCRRAIGTIISTNRNMPLPR